MLFTILAFLVLLTVLIYVHEMGHYLAARWYDVKVLRFSIGFGKPLVTWRTGADQTEWSIGAIPLGGYVKMVDERDKETPIAPADLPRAFTRQSLSKRAVVVAAGPIANFLLAIALYVVIGWMGVTEPRALIEQPAAQTAAANAGFKAGDWVRSIDGGDVRSWYEMHIKLLEPVLNKQIVPVVVERNGQPVELTLDASGLPDGAAEKPRFVADLGLRIQRGDVFIKGVIDGAAKTAGLQAGDQVLEIHGTQIVHAEDVIRVVSKNPGVTLKTLVKRDGATVELQLIPAPTEVEIDENTTATVGKIGVSLRDEIAMDNVQYGPLESMWRGVKKTYEWITLTFRLFGNMLTGSLSHKNISGPFTIADMAGKTASIGLVPFLDLMALISISLGVLNLLPVPVLDGGHLVYYALEAIKGKPLSDRFMDITQRAGVVAIMALMILAIFNDITRLIG